MVAEGVKTTRAVLQLAERTGAVLRHIPITDDGQLVLDSLKTLLSEKTKLAINKILTGAGEQAEVSVADDPHTINPGEKTPDLT